MSQRTDEYLQIMRATEDEMHEMDQIIVGGWVRLEVPFNSIAALRKWRDMMKSFIASVDFYCQPREPGTPYLEQRARLFHLRSEATNINRIMRGHKGPGRPKGSKTKRHPQASNSVDNLSRLK